MLTTRWESWTEMNRLGRELDRLFSGSGNGNLANVGSFPALNVWEDDSNLYAEAELPGFNLTEIELYVTGNQLTIKGERKRPEHAEGTWYRQERSYGKFSRTVDLPSDLDAEHASAEFKSGVLILTLPKSEVVKPRRIEVKSS